MNALCKSSLVAPGLMSKILQAENGQKVDEFEPIYSISVVTNIDEKWFVVFGYTTNHLFSYVRLPQLEYYFSCFASFFLLVFFFFLFLLPLSTFKPLNALHSKSERLKISGRTFVRRKSGLPGWGISLNRVFQNFELLNC